MLYYFDDREYRNLPDSDKGIFYTLATANQLLFEEIDSSNELRVKYKIVQNKNIMASHHHWDSISLSVGRTVIAAKQFMKPYKPKIIIKDLVD